MIARGGHVCLLTLMVACSGSTPSTKSANSDAASDGTVTAHDAGGQKMHPDATRDTDGSRREGGISLQDASTPPTCAALNALVASDAASARCLLGRLLLSCKTPTGSTAFCVSGDATACPEMPSVPGTCTQLCDPDEYAAQCANQENPLGCHPAGSTKPESNFGCCTCGS